MKEQAVAKLDKENEKAVCKTQKGRCVLPYVYDALKDFCEQNEEFARAIVQNNKTLKPETRNLKIVLLRLLYNSHQTRKSRRLKTKL